MRKGEAPTPAPVCVSRRRLLRWFGGSASLALLVACQPAPAAPPAPAAAPASTPAASVPRVGGTLRVGILGDIPNIDPHFTNGTDTVWNVWDRLVVYDARLNPVPVLAETIDFSADARQLKLTLRTGVQFHTGRELTSEDVAWNLNRLKTDPVVQVTGYPGLVAPLSSLETPDKYTVVLKSEQPWPGVFNLLALLNITDPVTMQSPNAKTTAVGTGPFKFVEYAQGDHLTLIKNPNYWAAGKPYVDGIVYTVFRDAQAMVSQLEGGSLDVADQLALSDAGRLQKEGSYQVRFNQATGNKHVLVLATTRPPTDNKLFRQALQFALDRARIARTVLQGLGVPSELPFGSSSPGFDPVKDQFYTFDLDKARALLAQSGVADAALDMNYSSALPEWALIGQLYQADLARIGINLTLKPAEPTALNNLLRNRLFSGMLGNQTNFGQLHPSMEQGNPTWSSLPTNFASFNSDQLTQIMTGLVQEADPAKQRQVYSQFNDYVLDQSWAIVVATNPEKFAATARVQGLTHNMEGQVTFPDAWLAA